MATLGESADLSFKNPLETANIPVSVNLKPATRTVTSKPKKSKVDVPRQSREILCNLSCLKAKDIANDSDLVELGIDSLMSMELTREVKAMLHVVLETDHLMAMTDFQSLVDCVRVFLGDNGEEEEEIAVYVSGTTNGVNGITNGVYDNAGYTNTATNGARSAHVGEVLPLALVQEAFADAKLKTDDFIVNGELRTYYHHVMPRSTHLVIAHVVNGLLPPARLSSVFHICSSMSAS